ncbi:MAG: putative two-component histidine kinase [Proteobacteria bacterium]|nr:putative two-component histidine kinase [Pseudomonadota bacterium]
MYQKLRLVFGRWLPYGDFEDKSKVVAAQGPRPFNLLRWFSLLSFALVAVISVGFASTLTHFLTREILQRDALLTTQFVHSIVTVQNQQARLGRSFTLGGILDERVNVATLGIDPREAASVRSQFYDHIKLLPDVLLANVFAADRKIIWSTNPALIGKFDTNNDELEDAIKARSMVATNYLDQENHGEKQHKDEQFFAAEPKKFFVETYMPLLNGGGDVLAVVEIYKEPESLLDAVKRCRQLVWACTALGMIFLYLAMFWIIRRADRTLDDQQRQILESETLCVVGEMSASVAHGIRNPLASIRSSAELALEGDLKSVQKNANDIISQVDRLSKWVRDLLVFSRPVAGENQVMDVLALIEDCLPNFAAQLEKNGINCSVIRPSGTVPRVKGNRSLATQALASVISNAIEAMPGGGCLKVELQVAEREHLVSLVVSDTGIGMSETQMDLVFKPFYTTKRNGLGLGMALVKRIMERFGGAIRLHSGEGKGTRVSLIFNSD